MSAHFDPIVIDTLNNLELSYASKLKLLKQLKKKHVEAVKKNIIMMNMMYTTVK